jgi:uncharacterized protein YdcH (DUF465 family)
MRSDYTYRRLVSQHAELDEIIDHLETHQASVLNREAEIHRLKKLRLMVIDQMTTIERSTGLH